MLLSATSRGIGSCSTYNRAAAAALFPLKLSCCHLRKCELRQHSSACIYAWPQAFTCLCTCACGRPNMSVCFNGQLYACAQNFCALDACSGRSEQFLLKGNQRTLKQLDGSEAKARNIDSRLAPAQVCRARSGERAQLWALHDH